MLPVQTNSTANATPVTMPEVASAPSGRGARTIEARPRQVTVLVSAWAGMGNLGDDWLLQCALGELAGTAVVLLVEPAASLPPPLSVHARLAWPRPGRRGLGRFRREAARAERVLFAGGGWLAGDQGHRAPARWVYRLQALPRGPQRVAAGIGVGPFPGGTALAGRAALARLGTVTGRTAADLEQARRLGRAIGYGGDLTLLADLPVAAGATSERSGVVIAMPAARAHWWPGTETEYRTAVRRVADAHRRAGETVRFVHFQHGPAGDSAFWEGQDRRGPLTVADAMAELAVARVVVAGRLHAAIMAARLGADVVAFGYHHKFAALGALGLAAAPLRALHDGTAPAQPQRAEPGLVRQEQQRVRAAFCAALGGGARG